MSLGFKLPNVLIPKAEDGAKHVRAKRLHRPKPANCLDCGQPITGHYCANCGQEAIDHRTALWPLVSDALGEFLRWDSKLIRTLIPLMVRPGFLTNEYNAGKRSRYISPFKLYLTVSIIFFLIMAQYAKPPQIKVEGPSGPHAKIAARDLARARTQIDAAMGQIGPIGDAGLSAASRAVTAASERLDTGNSPSSKPMRGPYSSIKKLFPGVDGHIKVMGGRDVIAVGQLPSTLAEYQELQRDPNYPYKNSAATQLYIAKFYESYLNPQLFMRNILEVLPKAVFVLLPLFALIMYVVYWRNGRFYVEHLALTLHNQTFAYIALTPLIVWSHSTAAAWLVVAIPVYYFVSMLIVYRQSWFTTLLKFSFVAFNSALLLCLALLGTLFAAFYLM